MKKIKHVNHKSITSGLIIGLAIGVTILLLSAYVKVQVSISDVALLVSIPALFGAFTGYSIT